MKLFLTMTFSLIAFLGIISQARDACAESLSPKEVYDQTFSSSNDHQNFIHEDLKENGQKDSDLHHNNPAHHGCYNCHLGHCAFILDSSILFSAINLPKVLTFATVGVLMFDFQTSPFRPPIA